MPRTGLSEPLVLVLVSIVVVLIALGGLIAVRRAVPQERLAKHTDVAGYVYAVVGVIYAVILAQVVVAAWEEYQDARTVSADEANAVLNLDRLSRSWPTEQREPLRAALINYANQVIEVEWPALARGDAIVATDGAAADRVWAEYNRIGQGELGESAKFSASLAQLDTLDAARRNRLLLAGHNLPQMMSLTLIIGAFVTVGFSYLFAMEDGWIQGLITACLAVMVALLLLLQYQLSTPFEGIDSLEPAAMRSVLTQIQAPAASLEDVSVE